MKNSKEHPRKQQGKKNQPGADHARRANNWTIYGALAIIALISFIAYLPAIRNGFVWDDRFYISDNPLLKSFNLSEIFSQNVLGNYHPLTILTLAVEYHLFGLNATGYHMVNILLHLMNVILVFYTVWYLSDKTAVALIAALFFGIHPMHVESVAWIAELKNLLFSCFFLLSYIFYLKYLQNPQKRNYILALILFLLSLLSKATAAALPVLLILTDYFMGRKLNMKTLVEKVPFFLLAIIIGVVAIQAQKSYDAIYDMSVYSFPYRVVFACYGFITYLWKLVLPLNLCATYPYPVLSGADLPPFYYAYVVIFLGLAASLVYLLRISKKPLFGIGFFAVTIFLVLQLIPVGDTIMADRYSYIPSIGIFYLAGEGLYFLWHKTSKYVSMVLISLFSIFFVFTTYGRCNVWNNELTLWNDVIEQYQHFERAYYNRGICLMAEARNDEAISDFSRAIELNPGFYKAYNSRGLVFLNKTKYEEALKDFEKAIELNPDDVEGYNNRGIVFLYAKRYDEALGLFDKAIAMNPGRYEAYFNRGLVFLNLKRGGEAIADFNKAIEMRPGVAMMYYFRGVALTGEKRIDEAIADFRKALELKPDYAEAQQNLELLLK